MNHCSLRYLTARLACRRDICLERPNKRHKPNPQLQRSAPFRHYAVSVTLLFHVFHME